MLLRSRFRLRHWHIVHRAFCDYLRDLYLTGAFSTKAHACAVLSCAEESANTHVLAELRILHITIKLG